MLNEFESKRDNIILANILDEFINQKLSSYSFFTQRHKNKKLAKFGLIITF